MHIRISLSAHVNFYACAFHRYCSISSTAQIGRMQQCINYNNEVPCCYYFLVPQFPGVYQGRGLGVELSQLPCCDLCLTLHLTPTPPSHWNPGKSAGAAARLPSPTPTPRINIYRKEIDNFIEALSVGA